MQYSDYYFDDDYYFDEKKKDLQLEFCKKIVAGISSEQVLEMLATILGKSFLEEDKITEKLFFRLGIGEEHAYAQLEEDKKLNECLENGRLDV